MRLTLLATLLVICIASPIPAAEDNLHFIPLFNGKDLAGWVPVNVAPNTFTVKDGVIHSTGVPTGIMRTVRQYENFVIELDWMHEKPAGNAGLFIWGAPMTAPGTPFAKGIEVQILDDAYVQGEAREKHLYTGHGDIFSIHGASMKPDRPHPAGWERCLPSEDRAKPAGEWNHYRVECRDGVIKLAVNGKVVSGASQCRPRKGYICLESEGSPAQFKNIRIAELPSTNPDPDECQPEAEDFRSIYTGVDLANWDAKAEHKAHWKADDWRLLYDGQAKGDAKNVFTAKEYGDITVILDWRVSPPADKPGKKAVPPAATPPAAGMTGALCVRGQKVVVPLKTADGEQPGQWHRLEVTLKAGRLSIVENDKLTVDSEELPGVSPRGTIGLMGDSALEFASIFVRELKP
jgi:hypothetical protein